MRHFLAELNLLGMQDNLANNIILRCGTWLFAWPSELVDSATCKNAVSDSGMSAKLETELEAFE